MPNETSRLSLAEPLTSDASSELRLSITNNATTLDDAVLVTEGTISSIPTASSVEKDHIYRATDTSQWFVSDGSNWTLFAPALSVPSGAMTSRTRVMETAYQPNASRPTFVIMTFHLVTTNIANNACQAVVLMDAANPPTTTIADASFTQSGGGSASTLDVPVSFLVPATFYYKPHVGAAGSSCTITSTFEYTL